MMQVTNLYQQCFRIAVFNSESDYKLSLTHLGITAVITKANFYIINYMKIRRRIYQQQYYLLSHVWKRINLLPEIAFFMSVDSALGDTIDVNVVEANDIVSNIYPNPSKDQLFVELKNEGKASIQLFNILGQEVKNISTLDNKTQVNVSDLKAGIYIVRVKQNNKVFTSKITIQ